ncbi:MAG: energy transducer TonB [Duncaniella sp.]|nr:energy transducer TonB [Duncaniella sp.]HBI57989.1 energy transducer TonB [Porphyromonadaceae bacterium]
MTRGKTTCRILKEIRQQIADANDIEFVTSECRYQGECAGTCPKCEAEVRYLESQLAARQLAGKAVALAGISAAIFLTGCGGTSDKVDSTTATEPVDSIACLSVEKDSVVTTRGEIDLNVVGEVSEEVILEIKSKEGPVDDNRIFNVAEQRPAFPGGEKALFDFIQKHIRYPETAKENNIQGRVVVQFVVTKTGEIGEVKVVRGKHPDLDKEAVRLVKSLPEFIPGTINDHPVNVWYTLQIEFRLDGIKASVKVPGKREEWRPPYKSR